MTTTTRPIGWLWLLRFWGVLGCLFVSALGSTATAQQQTPAADNSAQDQVAAAFLSLALRPDHAPTSLAWLEQNWDEGMVPMALEAVRFTQEASIRLGLMELVYRKTSRHHGDDLQVWQQWWWNQGSSAHESYIDFKRILYSFIDPKFRAYFERPGTRSIRLDEVVWGGVRQDGIPPLRNPQMTDADQATYLEDDNVVFGISVNGDHRAYPKRILAWHEMFVDTVGGASVAGVYCTLCGTVILYFTTVGDTVHQMGTSGFLYRSNKLMYDAATSSLWSTMRGAPVMGKLVGQDIAFRRGSVVTTTWGEWRKQHPDTRVLSLQTGHQRDYSEGAAYAPYFATDELMFQVPANDTRLANKAEVLALRSADGSAALAIASAYLLEHTVYQDKLDGTDVVVLTDGGGAHRVYDSSDISFIRFDPADLVATDVNGHRWQADEMGLHHATLGMRARVPHHRAFWFGWHAAFPHTRLVR
ncbi:MAG: DUF3179 domain-containing protein [Chromatiales bacterium]|nr:DUF3179 domain-containing protein [Chromatiales bacterium]